MKLFFLAHLLGFALPGFWLGHRLRLSVPLRVGLSFLIFEASLILGAGLLSWAGVLGHLAIYQFVTTLCAFAIAFGLWLVAQHDQVPSIESLSALKSGHTETTLLSSAVAVLLVFAGIMLHLTLSAYPSVEDSLTIKLPKVVFAIEANSILPTHLSDDGRMYISPVYPALVQLFLIINGQNGHALLAFGFVNWIVCGFAVYQLCRDVGSSRSASWIATALVLLSPILVAQGTSEGDDLMAATPFMISLVFLSAWLRRGGYFNALMAGLGLGFAVGFKFLALFFVPAIPIILLVAVIQYPWPEIQSWFRSNWMGALALSMAFVVALAPHLIANWAAFGNPLYVSADVASTRNTPFSVDCGLRSVVGYTKSFLFSDFIYPLISPTPASYAIGPVDFLRRISSDLHLFHVPDISSRAILTAVADKYQKFLSAVPPYNPIPACSAYGQPYSPASTQITDNTLWYGAFGPLLLISALVAAFSRSRPLWPRALGVGFLVWVLAFAFTEKYLAEIGRYWSIAVLAGSPTVAILLDSMMKRGALAPARRSIVLAAGLMTVILAITVLSDSVHRSIYRDEESRYTKGFSPELRALMKSATAVNVQVAYGIDTYDYYMLMGAGAKLTNLVAIQSNALNLVIVRPSGLIDSAYRDPRVAVAMKRPFAGGFAYYGKARPQPGYLYNLAFVNNIAASDHAGPGAGPSFLLFQAESISVNQSKIAGSIELLADDKIIGKTRIKIGWREPGGRLVLNDAWNRGRSSAFSIPAQAVAIVIQAAFDDSDNEGVVEWPIRGFDPGIVATLGRNSGLDDGD